MSVPVKKKRTRAHVIADLSENDFERHALLNGFSTESTVKDYGYDIILSTYTNTGEIENGFVFVQLKATDHISLIDNGNKISFSVDARDLQLWLNEFYPIILVVYDAQIHRGYWLYIQAYFQSLNSFSLTSIGDSVSVHIPISNIIDQAAIAKFRKYKADMYAQINNLIHNN